MMKKSKKILQTKMKSVYKFAATGKLISHTGDTDPTTPIPITTTHLR